MNKNFDKIDIELNLFQTLFALVLISIILIWAIDIYSGILMEKKLKELGFECTQYKWNYNDYELCLIDGELMTTEVDKYLPPDEICNGGLAINPNATYIKTCSQYTEEK